MSRAVDLSLPITVFEVSLTPPCASCGEGILLQFPSPYRAPSANSGNLQLPTAVDDDAYMVTTTLVQAVHQTLSPTGWFIIQSNVEDVAVHARGIAEAEGFYALPDPHDEQCDRSSPIRGDTSLYDQLHGIQTLKIGYAESRFSIVTSDNRLKSEQPRKTSYGQKRRERIVDAFGADFPRAVGSGWWDDNPLGNFAASETEAMLEVQGGGVYRCLLVPNCPQQRSQEVG